MFKNHSRTLISVAICVAPLLLCSTQVSAMNGTALTQPARTFLNDVVLSNVGLVSVLAAVIVGIIAALGQQIGKFVLNNLGYIAYVAFGGTMAVTALTATGMNI